MAILWIARIDWNVSRTLISGMPIPSAIWGVDNATIVILSALFEGQVRPAVFRAALTMAVRRVSNSLESETVFVKS